MTSEELPEPRPETEQPSPVERTAAAIDLLRDEIKVTCLDPQPDSHWGVLISGVDSDAAVEAFGVYGTALIAQIVGVDLVLSDELIGGHEEFRESLQRNVVRTIGSDNDVDANFRHYQRDPWITEALGHLLFALAKEESSHCVPGLVHALTLPHTQVREQGLDLIGVFALDDGVGICITESKASESGPGSQLAKAMKLFRAVDGGDRDGDILQALNLFRGYLSPEVRAAVPNSLWQAERSYAPLLAFRRNLNPATSRPDSLGSLLPAVDRRRLIVIKIDGYAAFFNAVSDAMRAAAKEY